MPRDAASRWISFFFFQAEDGIRDVAVTGVQTCALPISRIERPGVYVLQAGSYRNQSDADRVRAQLALQGIDARVQRVAVDADVWHRVRIGPVTRPEELKKLRKQLQAAEDDALLIRGGD